MENTAEFFNAINEQPGYLHSAIVSQAYNISKSSKFTEQDSELFCFLAACSSFILEKSASCFASPTSLINKYNEFAAAFNVKNTYIKKFRAIQARAIEKRMITYHKEFDYVKGQTRRHIKPILSKLNEVLPSAIKKAGQHAMQCIERYASKAKDLLNNCAQNISSADNGTSGGHDLKTSEKPSDTNALDQSSHDKLARIRSNTRSREYNNNTRSDAHHKIDGDFYLQKFKLDAKQAEMLQTQAKLGTITAAGAKQLIALHTKHAVRLGETFARYLKSVIIDAKQAQLARRQAKQQAQRQANSNANKPLRKSALDILSEKIASFRFND